MGGSIAGHSGVPPQSAGVPLQTPLTQVHSSVTPQSPMKLQTEGVIEHAAPATGRAGQVNGAAQPEGLTAQRPPLQNPRVSPAQWTLQMHAV